MTLTDRVALVTGAAGALGRAVAETFAGEGARLALAGRDSASLAAVAESLPHDASGGSPLLLAMDAASSAEVERAVLRVHERFGRADILVHTIGGFVGPAPVEETTVDDWDRMMDMNAKTAFLCCRSVFPYMKRQRYGRIIAVSARPAVVPTANLSAYAASKSALLSLVRTLALEGRDHGITVNAVLPGTLDTPENRRAMPDADTSLWSPLERVARVIAFLASEEASEVNGAAVPVYGRS